MIKGFFLELTVINFAFLINTSNKLEILAIVNNTKSNMGIIIIGMIVVILALVGYTLISNRK